MSDDNAFLVDAFRRLISETVTSERIRAVESARSGAPLWDELAGSGFLDALVPEADGGAGLTLAQAFPLVMALGEHAVPVPFAETMIARALLASRLGDVPQDAAIVLAAGSCVVPGGALATHALVERDGTLALVEAKGAGDDVFGTAGSLGIEAGETVASVAAAPGTLLLAAAAAASALMAGAMGRVLDMTLRYAGERQQFGRPLGKFQAIQQQLAVLAEQVISSQVAARTAFSGHAFEEARVAAAKCRASEAATDICGIAHAVHGAIGATAEFDLQLYTRRLKQWQVAFGSQSYWAERLGRLRVAAGSETSADFLRTELVHVESAS